MATSISLIVKGNEEEAVKAGAKHGVDVVATLGHLPTPNITLARAPGLQEAQVRAWFNDERGDMPPFPDGTLLHFTVPDNDPNA